MQIFVLVLLATLVFGLLSQSLRDPAQRYLKKQPVAIVAIGLILAAVIWAAALLAGVFTVKFALVVAGYTLLPAALAFVTARVKSPSWADLAIILLLWLPIEFPIAAGLIPPRAHGFLHSVAYGAAILLALSIFLLFRRFDGMRYQIPGLRDLAIAVAGFALAAPVLILIGRLLSFIPPYHHTQMSTERIGWTYLLILAATAMPEEILFRSLIQNWLMRKFGTSNRTIAVSALIFGAAHLNNGPGTVPNWRYALVASLAGFAFGKVFQHSNSVVSSAMVHAAVNTVKKAFF